MWIAHLLTGAPVSTVSLAIIASDQESLTIGSQSARYEAMRPGNRMGAAVLPAARRDLLLQTLALRHQLSVLSRSNRRFRRTALIDARPPPAMLGLNAPHPRRLLFTIIFTTAAFGPAAGGVHQRRDRRPPDPRQCRGLMAPTALICE
jgi:hypothetical protein